MNAARRSADQQEPQQETWPQKMNKVLIAIGVIAFGLIITDRVIEMFSADDVPAVQVELERNKMPVASSQNVSAIANIDGQTDGQVEESVDLQTVFGSRVVFVSASEPVYVVTEDDRRFDVGSEIDTQTTLAGVTAQQLILENAGGLTVISLPDPVAR